MANKKRGFWGRLGRLFLYLLAFSLLYVVVCKWLFPPITITQLSAIAAGDGLKRDYVNWDEISSNIKLAAIASEDQLFPDHSGFDWKSIEKSMDRDNSKRKRKKARGAGARTISQQVAKNVFLWQGKGLAKYIRKAPEAFYTACIELVWGKKRILEVYLNVIEMGRGVYGVEAAARQYFNKSARNLTRAEAAMIVAALPNPKRFTIKPMSRWVARRYPAILRQMNNLDGDPDIQQLIK